MQGLFLCLIFSFFIMRLFSTNHLSPVVSLEEAVFRGLPPDNGLYMPEVIPTMPAEFFDTIDQLTLQEIAFEVSKVLLGDDIATTDLAQLVERAITFEAPVVEVEANRYV